MTMKFFNLVWVFFLIGTFSLASLNAHAQSLSGTKTVCTSGCDYPTISAAVSSLNTNGVGSGGVNFNIAAGHVESLVSGIVVTVTGTSLNPIVFQKSGIGANPKLIAFTGSKLASSLDSIDVMMSFEGSDYVTIDGVDFQENVANTTPSMMMETAIGFYKKSELDGSSNNQIKNCMITLNRNNVTFSNGARSLTAGSVGIEFLNATRKNIGNSIVVSATNGTNSNNKIYSNTIQNSNFGISMIGYEALSPSIFADANNEIGSEQIFTGNTIINYGGGVGASSTCAAILMNSQLRYKVVNNNINNNTGTGVNHPNSNKGIWIYSKTRAEFCKVSNNKITISGGSSTSTVNWCIGFESLQTINWNDTIHIDSNQFLNCNVTSATTSDFSAIWVDLNCNKIQVVNNYIYGFTYHGTGNSRCIFINKSFTNLNISNNRLDSTMLLGSISSGSHYGIGASMVSAGSTSILDNVIRRITLNTSGAGSKTIYGIYTTVSSLSDTNYISGNRVDSVIRNGTTGGATYGIYSTGNNYFVSITKFQKNVINNISISGSGASSTINGVYISNLYSVLDSNIISNLSCQKSTGTSGLSGLYILNGRNYSITSNSVSYLTNLGTGVTAGIYFNIDTYKAYIVNNTIFSINAKGADISGINTYSYGNSVTPKDTFFVAGNRISDINSINSGNNRVVGLGITVNHPNGLVVSSYNNLIGNIQASQASSNSSLLPAVVGISISSTSSSIPAEINLIHNSVVLNAGSTGSNFTTAALYFISNSGNRLNIRNNIFVNKSTSSGIGKTVAFYQGSTLKSLNSLSNNNIFYSGTPSSSNLIFYDGTNLKQTLSDYKAWIFPGDSASFTENVNFITLDGGNPFFLKVNMSVSTVVEGGGIQGTNVNRDCYGNVRAGFIGYTGTSGAPDIGAWEDNYIPNLNNTMYFVSANTLHTNSFIPSGVNNSVILKIPLTTNNGAIPLLVTLFKLKTSGTTNTNDIINAKVYYTGLDSNFRTDNLFGVYSSPAGVYSISGSQSLLTGVNYFWLTYDVSAGAAVNNLLDAVLDSIVLSNSSYVPIVSSPPGSPYIRSRLSGRYTVGNGFDFQTITQATSTLYQLGVNGSVTFVLKNTLYNSSLGEVFPILLSPYAGSSVSNTVTFIPDSNLNVTIISDTIAIIFSAGSNFTIDGRKGGMGGFISGNNLIISTSSSANPAIKFVNDADSNQIIYSDIRSSNRNRLASGSTGNCGVVNFGASLFSNGNDNNTIKNCDIRNAGLDLPTVGVYSEGTSAKCSNDFNNIDSCSIYDFFNSSDISAGICLGEYNQQWLIRGNRFFQTNTRNQDPLYQTTRHYVILAQNLFNKYNYTYVNGIKIQNNVVSGNNRLGTGSYNIDGKDFVAFSVVSNGSLPDSIVNNEITNIISVPDVYFAGISFQNLNDISPAIIKGNKIGSRTVNGSIWVKKGENVTGIFASGLNAEIADNFVSGIDIEPIVISFCGISASTSRLKVSRNLIGDSLITGGAIRVKTQSIGITQQNLFGINVTNGNSNDNSILVQNNVVSNLFNYLGVDKNHVTTTKGIYIGNSRRGDYRIVNNLVSNIYTAGRINSGGINPTLGGIVANGGEGTFEISRNTIKCLHLTNVASTDRSNIGIYFTSCIGIRQTISQNEIHSQMLWDSNSYARVKAIDIDSGSVDIYNNIVRMGLDTLGNTITAGSEFIGISKRSGNSNIYFNTIYIGGINVYNTSISSSAFRRTGEGIDNLVNNVLINIRSNRATGGGGHYAIHLVNNNKLTSNYNLFYSDTVAKSGNTSYSKLRNWKINSSQDSNSIFSKVSFINANGNSVNVNLRVNPNIATPIESVGVNIPSSTDADFDGKQRSSLSPVDIGACAGNFSPTEVEPPAIDLSPLNDTNSTANRVIFASISDLTGVYTSGPFMPRIYFKKFAAGSYQSNSGVLVSGNALNGVWRFTIDSALINGVSGGDSIYYFVTAQDSSPANNLSSMPEGIDGNGVNLISKLPPSFAYKIFGTVSGTYYVGLGQVYPNLTGADGLFGKINRCDVNGDIIVKITSDIEEPGTIALLKTSEVGIGGYNIIIQPNVANVLSLTGGVNTGLIRLIGVKRLTIDGSYNGAGRYLRIMNRLATGVTILLQDEARRDTVKNCIIESISNSSGTILIGGSNVVSGIGNDSNAIVGCLIRDTLNTSSSSNLFNICVNNQGTLGKENDNNAILNNELLNFSSNAIRLSSIGTGNHWNLSGNKIYRTINKNSSLQIILIQGGSGHIISNNSIGGADTSRGGGALQSSSGITVLEIASTVSTIYPISVTSNVISNIASMGASSFFGVRMLGGNVVIAKNFLGGKGLPYDTIMNSANSVFVNVLGGSSVLIDSNLISNMYSYRTDAVQNIGIGLNLTSMSSIIIRRNMIQSLVSSATGQYTCGGILITNSPSNITTSITENEIRNIINFSVGSITLDVFGIYHSGGPVSVLRNRIINIQASGTGAGTSSPRVFGIFYNTSNASICNNQISLGNNIGNQTRIYGVYDGTNISSTYNILAYNSIFINGHTIGGTNSSFGIYRGFPSSIVNIRNNLIYNKRTSSGTGLAYAIASASVTSFTSLNFGYNLFIVNDTNRLLELPSGTSVGWSAMNNLYSASYNTNWAERTSFISPHTIFVDTLNGNLSIDTTSPAAWYVNGKGIRIPSISGDFNNASGVRSTVITTGATDIGSVEFSPTSLPPLAYTDKLPSANDSTRFYFASKIIAKAVWSNSGTLPALVNLRYYSGVNPANTPVSSTFSNAYYDIQTIGGSGYNYNLSLMNDSAILGSLTSINRAQIANYQNSSSNWIRYTNTTVSGNNGFLNAPIMTNIGVFTFTDSAVNPLPVSFSYFKAKVLGDDVILNWQTFSEKNNKGFYLERSTDGLVFNEFDFVLGKSNSSVLTNYISTDRSPFSRSRFLYYRLKQVDFDGNYQFSRVAMVHLDKTVKDITIYPNPVLTSMFVEINSSTRTNLSIQLIDVQGKELFSQFIKVEEGLNRILIPETIGLKTGIYFAKIIVDENVYQMKLVKE